MTIQPKATSVSLANANPLKKDASGKKAVKARLLLKLIKEGTIPRPPDSFLDELRSIAGLTKTGESSDLKERVKSLATHLQSIGTPKASKREAVGAAALPDPAETSEVSFKQPAPPPVQPSRAQSSLQVRSLKDQHPAVIQKQLEQLDADERAAQLRALPGETARQVSLLSWQLGRK